MTRLINEGPLYRREGTGGSHVPQALCPGDMARALFCHKSTHQLPDPSPLAEEPCLSGAESKPAPPGPAQPPAAPPHPPPAASRVWASGCGRGWAPGAPHHAHPGPGRSAACAYLAKSQASPGQLRVPAGNLGPIAQLAESQGTHSRLCPGGGEEIARNLHKALGCLPPRCHSPWNGGGEIVVTSPGTGPKRNRAQRMELGELPLSPCDVELVPVTKSRVRLLPASGIFPEYPSPAALVPSCCGQWVGRGSL